MTAALPALAKLKPNPDWATLPLFDRAGWKRVAFGEFAGSIGEHRGAGGAEGCAGGDKCGAGASGTAVPEFHCA